MVGRRNTLLVTKRSLRNADSAAGKRPKRILPTKLMEETVGMSRQEEQELNKALYASLQENRRSKSMPSLLRHNGDHTSTTSNSQSNGSSKSSTSLLASSSSRRSLPTESKSGKLGLNRRHSLRTGVASSLRRVKRNDLNSHKRLQTAGKSPSHKSRVPTVSSISIDESSQDSVRSSSSSANGSKRKIHAQRKFAQGCSLPGTPSSTPAKLATPPVKKISSRIPKTEDFLTFLCLRGASILPPHLDIFNYSREELPTRYEGSRPASSGGKMKRRREGTPDSSSTSSGANEEVAEAAQGVRTPTSAAKSGASSLLAQRSAARASAGTPETARGILSLRQGLQRKVSSSSSSRSSSPRFPVASNSPYFSPCRAQQPVSSLSAGTALVNPAYSCPVPPARNHRPKFYFTPEKSPSPSKASGVRPGEFTPPSLHYGTPYFGSVRNFSPLVCRPSTSKSASPVSTPVSHHSVVGRGLPSSSSSSSSYPSSSRSSWSSTATERTPKRHRKGMFALSRDDADKVIPVCITQTPHSCDCPVKLPCKRHTSNISPSSCSSLFPSVSSFPSHQSLSNAFSLSQPSASSVASSTACLLSPSVPHDPMLQSNGSYMPDYFNVPSHVSRLYSSTQNQLSTHHLSHTSEHRNGQDCHPALPKQSQPSPLQTSQSFCLNSYLSDQCTTQSDQHRKSDTNSFALPHRDVNSCSMHANPSADSQLFTCTKLSEAFPLYQSCACSSNKNCDSMYNSNPNPSIVHATVTANHSVHDHGSSHISNPSQCLNPYLHASCFKSVSDQCCTLSGHSCHCPDSFSYTNQFSDVSSPECTKKIAQSPCSVPRVHVSMSCTCELHSLSGQTISTASEWDESVWNGCERQEEILQSDVQQSQKDKTEMSEGYDDPESRRGWSIGCEQLGREVNEMMGNLNGSEVDKANYTSATAMCGEGFADSKDKHLPISEHVIDEYDFAIVNEGKLARQKEEKTNFSKKHKKSEKARLEKKKHRKRCRKKIKIKQAEFRVPKLTIRILKKQKNHTSRGSLENRLATESCEPAERDQSNFQQQYVKMLETRSTSQQFSTDAPLLSAEEEDLVALSEPESEFSLNQSLRDNLLSDYQGCVSESEMFASHNASAVERLQKKQVSEGFQNSDKPNAHPDNQNEAVLSGKTFLACSSHPGANSFRQKTFNSKQQSQLPSTEAGFDSNLLVSGEMYATKESLKMRDKVIKAYSKFNSRDTIISNIKMTREADPGLSKSHQNWTVLYDSTKKFDDAVKKDTVSNGHSVTEYDVENEAHSHMNLVLSNDDQIDTPGAQITVGKAGGTDSESQSSHSKIDSGSFDQPTCPVQKMWDKLKSGEKDKMNISLKNSSKLSFVKRSPKQEIKRQALITSREVKGGTSCFKKRKISKHGYIKNERRKHSKFFKGNHDQPCPEVSKSNNCSFNEKENDSKCARTRGMNTNRDVENEMTLNDEPVKHVNHCSLSSNSTCKEREPGQYSTSRQSKPEGYAKSPHKNDAAENIKSFEKGKSHLIDQILDWASMALNEIAKKCSFPEGQSKNTSNFQNVIKVKGDAKFHQTLKDELPKLKGHQSLRRTMSDLLPIQNGFDVEKQRKARHHQKSRHTKKKMNKSDDTRHKKHCCKSKTDSIGCNTGSSRKKPKVFSKSNKQLLKPCKCPDQKKLLFVNKKEKRRLIKNPKKARYLIYQDAISDDNPVSGHITPQLFENGNTKVKCRGPSVDVKASKSFVVVDDSLCEDKVCREVNTSGKMVEKKDDSDSHRTSPHQLQVCTCVKRQPDEPLKFVQGSEFSLSNHAEACEKRVDVSTSCPVTQKPCHQLWCHSTLGNSRVQDGTANSNQARCKDFSVDKENLSGDAKAIDLSISSEKSLPIVNSYDKQKLMSENNVQKQSLVQADDKAVAPLDLALPWKRQDGFEIEKENQPLQIRHVEKNNVNLIEAAKDHSLTDKNACSQVLEMICHEKKSNSDETNVLNLSSHFVKQKLNSITEKSYHLKGVSEARNLNECCGDDSTSTDITILFEKVRKQSVYNLNNTLDSLKEKDRTVEGQNNIKLFNAGTLLDKSDKAAKDEVNYSISDGKEDSTSAYENIATGESKSDNGYYDLRNAAIDMVMKGLIPLSTDVKDEKYSLSEHNGPSVCESKILSGLQPNSGKYGDMVLEKTDNLVSSIMGKEDDDDDVIGTNGVEQETGGEIAVHSYGSLNTGQGFAVVNGRFEKCTILDKERLPWEKENTLEENVSKQQNSQVDQLLTGWNQNGIALDKTEDKCRKPFFSSPPCNPAFSDCVHSPLIFHETTKSLRECVKSGPADSHVQPVFSKGAVDAKPAGHLWRHQMPKSASMSLTQARPQLQRSIYLEAKEKEKLRQSKSLGNPYTATDWPVKVFQKHSFNSRPWLKPAENCSRAKSWFKTNFLDSTIDGRYLDGNSYRPPMLKSSRSSHKNGKDKYTSSVPTAFSSRAKKSFTHSHSYPREISFPPAAVEAEPLYSTNRTPMILTSQHSLDMRLEPGFATSSCGESMKTVSSTLSSCQDFNMSSSGVACSPHSTYHLTQSSVGPVPYCNQYTSYSASVDSVPHSIVTSHISNGVCQPYQVSLNMPSKQSYSNDCDKLKDDVRACLNMDQRTTQKLGESQKSSTAQWPRHCGKNLWNTIPFGLKSYKKHPYDMSYTSLCETSSSCSPDIYQTDDSENESNVATSLKNDGMQESTCPSRTPRLVSGEAASVASHSTCVSTDTQQYDFPRALSDESSACTASSTPTKTAESKQAGLFSQSQGSQELSVVNNLSILSANVSSNSHASPPQVSRVDTANLPLDLSSNTDVFEQKVLQMQKDFYFDITSAASGIGLTVNVEDKSQDPDEESNENILDAVMAELKLQIDQLKGQILL